MEQRRSPAMYKLKNISFNVFVNAMTLNQLLNLQKKSHDWLLCHGNLEHSTFFVHNPNKVRLKLDDTI